MKVNNDFSKKSYKFMNGQQKYKPGLREEDEQKRWENHKDGLETQTATKKACFIKTKCLGKGKLNKWKKKKTVQSITE